MSVNVNFTGRLGGNGELRYTPSGTAVANFSVATNAFENGQKVTQWVRVSYFGQRAESVNQYLTKGTLVAVSGTLRTPNIFTRQDGTPGVNIEVNANNVELHGGGEEAEEPRATEAQTQDDNWEDDDIPF